MQDSYVLRFGDHIEWNELHDFPQWQPQTFKQVEESDSMQALHFLAFFVADHSLRHAAHPELPIVTVVSRIIDALCRVRAGGIWFHVLRRLHSFLFARRRMRSFHHTTKANRMVMLQEWLTFWQDAEARVTDGLRVRAQSLRLNSAINPKKASQAALANALVSTPDPLKVKVLWELYWLLRKQDSIRCLRYWDSRLKLLALQREMRTRPMVYAAPLVPDFQDEQPQTPRAVLAALFVLELQFRRPLARPGRDLTFKELVRIASTPHCAYFPREIDCPEVIATAPPTVVGFLTSSLCRNWKWIPKQFSVLSSYPFLPRLRWDPLATSCVDDAKNRQ
eukprot:GGOE01032370.1.p1 GENE.GGOE01032370.1~~GGOE01032370.1.p1  ORF type:complete len:347 (-),score=41.18 GGOE01032370.1:1192-2196(-)